MKAALTLVVVVSLALACGDGNPPAPLASLEGRVTLQGASDSSGVSIVLAGTEYSASTAADGAFTLPAVAPGSYQLLASYPGYARAGLDVTAETGTLTLPSLELVPLAPLVTTARVIGVATLEGASDSSAISITVPGTSFAASTDSEGKYALELPPGDYTLSARAPGYVGQTTSVQVEAGGEITASTLVLPRAFTAPPLIAASTLSATFPGALFALEGLHFGDEQGSSAVYLGTTAATDIVSWSEDEILLRIPATAALGPTSVSIVVGGQQATALLSVVAAPKLVPISAGEVHSLAIASDGHVVGWGEADHGATEPPQGLANVVQVAAGNQWSLALAADGTVVAWGRDSNGQTKVPAGLTGVVMIAAGHATALALRADGSVVGWGQNDYGQLNGLEQERDAVSIAAGFAHTVVLRASGQVAVFGDNSSGEQDLPFANTGIVAISSWGSHVLALRQNGSVRMWGDNTYGQSNVPSGLPAVTAVATGKSHSVLLKPDGTVLSWGNNYFGEANVPPGLSNVVAVAAGALSSLALKADGKVVAWGPGQLGSTWVPADLVARVP